MQPASCTAEGMFNHQAWTACYSWTVVVAYPAFIDSSSGRRRIVRITSYARTSRPKRNGSSFQRARVNLEHNPNVVTTSDEGLSHKLRAERIQDGHVYRINALIKFHIEQQEHAGTVRAQTSYVYPVVAFLLLYGLTGSRSPIFARSASLQAASRGLLRPPTCSSW